jgi:multidrug efflux pump subunit AcrA (membrane-fusion protein)
MKVFENNLVKKLFIPKWQVYLNRVLVGLLISLLVILTFVPWVQTSQGEGKVIAYSPNDRIQSINATVDGRINKWFISDGTYVRKGDPIVEIVDNDPNYVERLKLERDAAYKKYQAYKMASETALLNYERQKKLYNQGLSARTKYEKAKIEYQKLLSYEAEAAASLAKAEVKLSRQETQLITSPRDGTILRVLYGSGSVQVKKNQQIATFVPDVESNAVEIYVDGNDLPLIQKKGKVRLQFEGWPAVQFSGWPSVAIGTFGGIVKSTDPSVSDNGKFRVIIVPDENDQKWPDTQYLRQGTRVLAWLLLNEVSIGFELWRKLNGFPIAVKDSSQKNKEKDEEDK